MWETHKTGLWITRNIKNPKQINLLVFADGFLLDHRISYFDVFFNDYLM